MEIRRDGGYVVPINSIISGEFSFIPQYAEDAVVDYVEGTRLINDGVAIIDRLNLTTNQTDSLFLRLTTTAIDCDNLERGRGFARRIQGAQNRFEAYISLAWSNKESFREDLDTARSISMVLPLMNYRIGSLIHIAQTEIAHGLDPKLSMDAAKLAIWHTLSKPKESNTTTKNAAVYQGISSCLSLAQIEGQLGQDPTNTLEFALAALNRVLLQDPAYLNLCFAIAEFQLLHGLVSTESLNKIRERIPYTNIGFQEECKFRLAALEAGFTSGNPLSDPNPTRPIVFTGIPEVEEEEGKSKPVQESHRDRLANNLLMARVAVATGGNPWPYFDSAKEEVLLRMVKNSHTEEEYSEIAAAEISSGLARVKRAYPLVIKLSLQDFSNIFNHALSNKNALVIASLGTLLPVALQDKWIEMIPVHVKNGVQQLFFQGRIWASSL